MATFPLEIWHEIFALACTDTGLTGRSLSLVSKHFHDISRPFKYQSIAITRWGQLIAFSQTISQLPDFEKQIKYLFIHCPYPFLDVEDNPSIANDPCKDPVNPGTVFVPDGEDSDSDSDHSDSDHSDLDYSVSESDSEWDSEFDGSLDSHQKQEVLEDVAYLYTGKTREDEADDLDYDIQAVFGKAIQALHVILNECSSTLNILTLYWTSFRPLLVHQILPPLPFLDELHLFRCSIVTEDVHDDSSTTVLFPRLRFLFMSGDRFHRSVSRSVPKIAPNLTHFRFPWVTYTHDLGANGWYSIGDVVVKISTKWATDQIGTLVRGTIDKSELSQPVMGYLAATPEAWLYLWSSRVAGQPEAWSVCE